ncbi:hypothetical protein SDC9_161439 [bioreactor metagenome]|uniref:Uncharacterized protein n=1 Tax=bioreactor metagenome TaxID=1076179 RepID=A0A645FPJ2_9ZZZZ
MSDNADFTFIIHLRRQRVRRFSASFAVIGRHEANRNIRVYAGVKGDNLNTTRIRRFHQRSKRIGIQRRQQQTVRLLRHGVFNQLNLFRNLSFVRRSDIAGFIAQLFRCCFRPHFHGLPEFMLEAFTDDRKVQIFR